MQTVRANPTFDFRGPVVVCPCIYPPAANHTHASLNNRTLGNTRRRLIRAVSYLRLLRLGEPSESGSAHLRQLRSIALCC